MTGSGAVAAAEGPVLERRGVAKSYGATPALRGVDLTVGRGELVGLLGPNGAGKSTLFRICAGLFAPDEGRVALFGSDYRAASGAILSRLGVVFQARSLDLDITVRANLRFHGGLFGLWGARLRARIAEVAAALEITEMLGRPVRQLSGGNQRRVEIARALISAPDLLLLDEPSTGLDPTARRRLVAQVRERVVARGTSVLWATHLADEVAAADRIVLLVNGAVAHQGEPAELLRATGSVDLTEAYVALTGPRPPAPGDGG